ncbi:MAG TPA: hypothetical protein VIK53_10095 [Verrucomicrobiae bacterium]
MKKYIAMLIVLATMKIALAIPITSFESWDVLIKNSPEIVIARCTSTLDFISASNKVVVVTDGIIRSDIEVVSVLKGTPNPGLSHLASEYWPYRGEYFLVFASNQKDQYNVGYTAIEGYRIISLGHNFTTNQMTGKPLEDQIQFLLKRRLKELNEGLTRDNEEKLRLEMALKEKNNDGDTSSNALPVTPKI